MANYECVTRSNYFHVKDPAAFRKFMSRVYGGDTVDLWEEKDANEQIVFGFGVYGDIIGFVPENDDDEQDCDYDTFLDELQKHIAEDDAVIILESGHEKLRYVIGRATVITSKEVELLDVSDIAAKRVAFLLGLPEWENICEY